MKKLFGILLVIIILLSGCASIKDNPTFKPDTKADPGMGYFFGTLSVYNKEIWEGGFGLQYINLDNEKETVSLVHAKTKRNPDSAPKFGVPDEFRKEMMVIVPVKPGRYKLTTILFLHHRTTVEKQKDVVNMPEYTQEIVIQPGTMYYIGDWVGAYHYSESFSGRSYNWNMVETYNRFEETKAVMEADYPAFTGWKMENTIQGK
ncbi:MAG: hypothetical protein JW904_07100 [Spirochaetales bacterium]|nr:hypothetical protein [Spirochaetales bacterium]